MASNADLGTTDKMKTAEFNQNVESKDSDGKSDKDGNRFHQLRSENHQNFREYAQHLQLWLWQYRMWNSMNNWLPYYCMYPPNQLSYQGHIPTFTNLQQPQQSTRPQNIGSQQYRQPATVHTNLTGRTGTEYQIPPLWKRVVAELLDFVVLFYLKVMLTIIVMRQLGYLKNDNILDVRLDLLPVLDITEITEVDFEKAFSLTSEIIALEILNRIFITLFETLCLRKGPGGTIGGATPGKRVLGLKVVSCEEVLDLRNGKLLVIPAHNIGFLSALVRSVIKNFTMAFFFPACFTVFFFQHNRAAYDVLAKTIVVQAPVIRQQQQ